MNKRHCLDVSHNLPVKLVCISRHPRRERRGYNILYSGLVSFAANLLQVVKPPLYSLY
ncbi:hypothetical protein FA15DRAFT_662391 [Coprinopsis marcescibilis]|uniref:Uncharacterized protein n=1 Tax=Coprinopsis marcescibilis TaxID=230819 RepID=A0A5C3LCC0_COPMA|nr:hypothetical protein FA15DRAFT_662391 [Coprinopsis marcescibilis]